MNYDLIVIGAGISGLGLAHCSGQDGKRTLVVEASERVGGSIKTANSSQIPEFWLEAGAHTCYNSYGTLLKIVDKLGLKSEITPKHKVAFRLLRKDRISSILAGLHPLELAWFLPNLIRAKKGGRSIREYYTSILGPKNYNDLFGPAFNAVICQPADNFPAELLFRPKPRDKTVPRSYTFPNGLSTLPNAIANQPHLEILTNTVVKSIDVGPQESKVITENGQILVTKKIALATPPNHAAYILADKFPELAGILGDIGVAKITSISLMLPANSTKLPPMAGVIAPYEPFYSMVTRDYLKNSQYRGFSFHFPQNEIDSNRQLARIREILMVPKDGLDNVIYTQHQMPALKSNHMDLVARIDRVLAKTGLALTGNYFTGVSIEDCLQRSFSEWQRITTN
ncbi:hypothetical protein TI04_03555 [Achromatium sp. WMS2]|nr:hypothetical protein TI04_03555 [Achromatium sp. WMS2]